MQSATSADVQTASYAESIGLHCSVIKDSAKNEQLSLTNAVKAVFETATSADFMSFIEKERIKALLDGKTFEVNQSAVQAMQSAFEANENATNAKEQKAARSMLIDIVTANATNSQLTMSDGTKRVRFTTTFVINCIVKSFRRKEDK